MYTDFIAAKEPAMNLKNLSPWAYVPTAYFMEGVPYAVINVLSAVMYSKLGVANDVFIFWTSWLYLPWVLKMFWSPFVEGNATKRLWILFTQYALAWIFLFIALSLNCSAFFTFSVLGFFIGAFISATHDIALDGYYMIALDEKKQSSFVGWRTVFYRFAMIAVSGPLVVLAAKLQKLTGDEASAWAVMFCAVSLLTAVAATYHKFILPRPAEDKPAPSKGELPLFAEVFKAYFKQENIIYILLFILLYRFGDACLEKVVVPFLLKPESEGALAVSTEAFGYIKGTLGLLAVIAGNILGGFLLSRYGFRRCIWYFAVILVLPNFFYAYMAWFHPSLKVIGALLVLENFGNGLAMMAFTVFIMFVSQGKYKTSFYAISTGIMAFGMMIPNMLSGKLQVMLGYKEFFLAVSIAGLVTFAVIPLCYKIKQLKEADAFIAKTDKSEFME